MKELHELTDNELKLHLLYEGAGNLKQQLQQARKIKLQSEINIKDLNSLIVANAEERAELERKGVKRPEIKQPEIKTPGQQQQNIGVDKHGK